MPVRMSGPAPAKLWAHGWWILAAAGVVGAFLFGLSGAFLLPNVTITWPDSSVMDGYRPDYVRLGGGTELVLVYLGSSACGFSNDPTLPALVSRAKTVLKQRAQVQEWAFTAVGVAIDWVTDDGVEHLRQFGAFDEIMTGRKWQGMGAYRYFEDLPGTAGTPQILVMVRETAVTDSNVSRPPVVREWQIHRVIGVSPIMDWVNKSLPLPQDRFQAISTESGPAL